MVTKDSRDDLTSRMQHFACNLRVENLHVAWLNRATLGRAVTSYGLHSRKTNISHV